MSAALLPPFETSPETPPRKRFRREEVERLTEAGAFEGQRVELIDGDLIDKMGQKPPHAATIRRLADLLQRFFDGGRVQVQLPVEVSGRDGETSLPEPDISVLAGADPEHENRHPRGDECLLVIEVSDASARFDLGRKAVLYANAGVREYWVIDLNRRVVVAHRQPEGSTYRLIQQFLERDSISLEGRAESIRVNEILPPESTAPDTVR